jgi:hypothetical protein
MVLNSSTKTKVKALADGSILPVTGMEKHFVKVCDGSAEPCTEEEREWYRFIQDQKQRLSQKESIPDISYNYGLPGMAELDAIVKSGVDVDVYPDLKEAILTLSNIVGDLVYLRDEAKSIEEALQLAANKAADVECIQIFLQNVQENRNCIEEDIRKCQTEKKNARAAANMVEAKIDNIEKKIDAIYKLDAESRNRADSNYVEKEQEKIKRKRAQLRSKYEDLVAQLPGLNRDKNKLEAQISASKIEIFRLRQEMSELDHVKPRDSDRLKAYNNYMKMNSAELLHVKNKINASQKQYDVKEGQTLSILEILKPIIVVDKVKASMTSERRKTFVGRRSIKMWGDYRPNWIDFERLLCKNKIDKLYHFTDRKNLKSILELGGLFSWKALKTKEINVPSPGGNDLSRRRDQVNRLEDYVRLSFVKFPPMLHSAKGDGRIQTEFIIEISPDVVFFAKTKFADQNAAQNLCGVNIGSSLKEFRSIRFDLIFESHWDDDSRKYFQAEVLVPQNISSEFILNWNAMEKVINRNI